MAERTLWEWKYFDSLESAREAVGQFEDDMQTELVKTYDHVYDPTKCKIQKEEGSLDPFIVLRHSELKCKGSKDYIKKEVEGNGFENGDEGECAFNTYKGWRRTNCYLQIIIREIMKFPGYREFADLSEESSFHNVKRIDRKKIRSALETNDELLIKELGWCIKFPLNPIPCCHNSEDCVSLQLELETDNFETKMDFSGEREVYEVFPTKEFAKAAIEKFEITTMSQFIVINRRAYDTSKGRVRWDETTLIPYLIAESAQMECRRAKNRNLESNMKRRSLTPRKTQRNVKKEQGEEDKCPMSKKMNCKATLSIYSVYTFPQFRMTKNTKNYKMLKSRALKTALQHDLDVLKIFECRVKFPSNEQHTHPLGEEAGLLQATDRRLHVKLQELTDKGIFNVTELQKRLECYVENELFKGEIPPSRSNRRFYPKITYFRLGVYKAKKKLEKEGIDLFSRHANSKSRSLSDNIQAIESIQEIESSPTTTVSVPENAPFSLEELLGEDHNGTIVKTQECNYEPQGQNESTVSTTQPNSFQPFVTQNHEPQSEGVQSQLPPGPEHGLIVQSWQSNETEAQMQRSIHHITDLLQSIQDHTVEVNSTQALHQTESDLVTVLNNLRQSSDHETLRNPVENENKRALLEVANELFDDLPPEKRAKQ